MKTKSRRTRKATTSNRRKAIKPILATANCSHPDDRVLEFEGGRVCGLCGAGDGEFWRAIK